MKLLQNSLLGLVIIILVFSGCKKNEKESVNYLQVGDTTIYLSDGNKLYFGQTSDNTYNFDIELVSSNIALSTNPNGFPVYTGKGTYLYFEVFTSSSSSLADGEYTFFFDANTSPAGTYDAIKYSFEYAYETDYNFHFVTEGTLTIKNIKGGMEVSFTGENAMGEDVKMYYKGVLNYYEILEGK